MKPVLLLDMDGPLADFDSHGWEMSKAAGHEFDIPDPSHRRHRYFTEHMPHLHHWRWGDPVERLLHILYGDF